MMTTFRTINILLVVYLLAACGEPSVSFEEVDYQPHLNIQGILIAGQPVAGIYILRDFPATRAIPDITLPDAYAVITDLDSGSDYVLTYDEETSTYYDPGASLITRAGYSYQLHVSATVSGVPLTASVTTTLPAADLQVVAVNHDSLRYYQRDSNDQLLNFNVRFQRSPGTDFYMYTIRALEPSVQTFIFDNAFEEVSEADIVSNLHDYEFEWDWTQNTLLTPGISDIDLLWFDFWFYSRYEVVLFATDRNYRDYLQTYDDVQEIDGNFHAPAFHFDGDGIGVFGSAAADTFYITVTQ